MGMVFAFVSIFFLILVCGLCFLRNCEAFSFLFGLRIGPVNTGWFCWRMKTVRYIEINYVVNDASRNRQRNYVKYLRGLLLQVSLFLFWFHLQNFFFSLRLFRCALCECLMCHYGWALPQNSLTCRSAGIILRSRK